MKDLSKLKDLHWLAIRSEGKLPETRVE